MARVKSIEYFKRTLLDFMAEYRGKFPEAISVLVECLEDSLQLCAFPEFDHRKIVSTNVLERMFR